jgi:hypothetical protein
MPKELKIILIFFGILTILTAWIVLRTNQIATVTTKISNIEALETIDQLGEVPRLGGVVVKEYSFKNTGDQPVKLGRLNTSCMCTKAKVVIGDKESQQYGMESPGSLNPSLGYILAPGQTGKVVVYFDPDAHGPKGIGPFSRVISLYFQDPQGLKEFKFSGTVR